MKEEKKGAQIGSDEDFSQRASKSRWRWWEKEVFASS
jgi:hypothetical protein